MPLPQVLRRVLAWVTRDLYFAVNLTRSTFPSEGPVLKVWPGSQVINAVPHENANYGPTLVSCRPRACR